MTRQTSLFFDAAAVRAACEGASTMKDALEALDQRPRGSAYSRLREACRRYDVPVPGAGARTPRALGVRRVSVFADDDAVRSAVAHSRTRAQALGVLGVSTASKNYRQLANACERLGLEAPRKVHSGNHAPHRTGRGDDARARLGALPGAELTDLVERATSTGALLSAVGLSATTGNVELLRTTLAGHGLDLPNGRATRRHHNDEMFTVKYVHPTTLKQRIIDDNLLPWDRCTWCACPNEWNGKALVLELDHINGVTIDNRLENLRFLCPNCHSQTPTFRGRNIGVNRLTAAAPQLGTGP